MKTVQQIVFLVVALGVLFPAEVSAQQADGNPPLSATEQEKMKKRTFEFVYSGSVLDVPQGAKVRIWIPLAQDTPFQKVVLKSQTLPVEGKKTVEPKYQNHMLHMDFVQKGTGNVGFHLIYDVMRKEAEALGKLDDEQTTDLQLFLKPNSKVPVSGKPVEKFEAYKKEKNIGELEDSLKSGRVFYDFVESHMKYDKSVPGYGDGDSNWACDSRTGNCTDFHSLFISVARANQLPSKFQIGFPLPATRGTGVIGGYHCWAQFYSGEHGWVPVDISEADKDPDKLEYFFGRLNENRIQFTTGRDIDLVPKQDTEPLNYFVYPHVEVDGKLYPKEKVKLKFQYKDLE